MGQLLGIFSTSPASSMLKSLLFFALFVGEIGLATASEPNEESELFSQPGEINNCAFFCGRCYFMHSQDEEHDCVGVSVPATCAGLICAGALALIPQALSLKLCPNLSWLSFQLGLPCVGLCCAHGALGLCLYGCAQDREQQDFLYSFDRGMICLPGDSLSCTALTKKSFKQHKSACLNCCSD